MEWLVLEPDLASIPKFNPLIPLKILKTDQGKERTLVLGIIILKGDY